MTTIEKMEQLIIFHLGDLNREIFNRANKAFVKSGIPLQVEQLPVIMTCYCHGEVSQQEIATLCSRDKSSINRTITYLVKHNFVEITQDPADKRKNIVRLTDEGKKLGKRIEDYAMRMEHELLTGKISEEEKKAFINQIKRFKNAIIEH